jgi:hypothetical protein
MDRVGFGEEIGKVLATSTPGYSEVLLTYAVADPMIAHVDGFGFALFACAVANAGGALVVAYDFGVILWISEVFQGGT